MKKSQTFTRTLALMLLLVMLLQVFSGCQTRDIVDDIAGTTTAEVEESSSTPEPEESTGGEDTSDETTTGAENGTTTGEETPPPEPPKYNIYRSDLTYSFTEEQEKEIADKIDALENAISEGTMKPEDFQTLYDGAEDLMYKMQMAYQVANLESYLYMTDEAITDRFLHISEYYNEQSQRFVALYRTIYESQYKEPFYAEWTEEEIEEALDAADTYDEELSELLSRLDELQLSQSKLSPEEYQSGSVAIYQQMVPLNNQIAEKFGYSGYMEYAYADVYDRDYSVEEATKLENFAAQYLGSLIDEALNAVNTTKLTGADMAMLRKILNGSFEDPYSQTILDAFYASLSPEINAAYKDFKENGYCFVAYDDTLSKGGAFTFYIEELGAPVMYFGPGYDDIFTFVHEFGHYYSYYKEGEGADSYDLAETQSQADEWLLLSFLSEKRLSAKAWQYLVDYRTVNDMLMLMVCLTVHRFEQLAYAVEDPLTADFDALYKTAADQIYSYDRFKELMGYSPEEYWRMVVIENPGYYISYAISLIPVIELYALSRDNYANAAAIYEKLQGNSGEFCEALVAAGLHTPFEEEVYVKIQSVLSGT